MDSVVENILKDILPLIGFPTAGIARTEIAGQIVYSIEAGEAGRDLIGPHGDTIHALDMLVKKMAEKKLGHVSHESDTREPLFLIDVNGHRTQKIQDLQTKAMMMAERARSMQYDVELEPMSGYERLIVHTTLQGQPHVKTESQGEGRDRRIVIKYSAS